MIEKVVLPKYVADAIKELQKYHDNQKIVYLAFKAGSLAKNIQIIANFAADNFDEFLNALVNGYEVEQTPEERIKQKFDHAYNIYLYNINPAGWGFCEGVKTVLNEYGTKIPGINAPEDDGE
ncbi:DUF1642 domain-containing protein [Tuberibacillus sp. Marseille-P3662]|uniref:DUF1642 domain-containing protein n=1 Tax=Tuberibacillus sp. Marseille-P3662 TaxID=1965358 RepID=UPI001592D334|nr:DUF1642 domain-containing protein [Tuberibacillus sp. Marseille-P3662]